MRTIVTGGSGFIGSHLVKALVDRGDQVIVIDTRHVPIISNKSAKYFIKDITNYNSILPLFNQVDCVFHLAAESRINTSIDNPRHSVAVNVLGTTNVLECCYQWGVPRFINSSSSSVYGLTNVFPTKETTPSDCLNPYAASKLAAEEIIKCYTRMGRIKYSCNLRYFNVYGEHSPVENAYSLVIGIFLQQAKSQQPLTVVGTGSAKRDFIYVGDVVSANIKAMLCDKSEYLQGNSYNVGSGDNIRILDIAKTISEKIEYIASRQGEADETLADCSRIKEAFGWAPTVSIKDWILHQLK